MDALALIAGDAEVMKFVDTGVPLSRTDCARWIEISRENVAREGSGTGAVIEGSSGRLIGWAGLARPAGEQPELVFGLAREAWGKGYGTELVAALRDYLLNDIGMPEICATVHRENIRSRRMLERLGFRAAGNAPGADSADWRLYLATSGGAAEVIIRPATPRDAERIGTLHAQSWRDTYRGIFRSEFLDQEAIPDRIGEWRRRFSSHELDSNIVLLAEEGEELLGFAHACFDGPPWGVMLDNLHVRSHLKGRGLGRRLLKETLGEVLKREPHAALHLIAYEKNFAARLFYEKLGGQVVERFIETAPGGGEVVSLRYRWERAGDLHRNC